MCSQNAPPAHVSAHLQGLLNIGVCSLKGCCLFSGCCVALALGKAYFFSGPQFPLCKKTGVWRGRPGDLEMFFYLEWLLRVQGGSEESPDSQNLGAA